MLKSQAGSALISCGSRLTLVLFVRWDTLGVMLCTLTLTTWENQIHVVSRNIVP